MDFNELRESDGKLTNAVTALAFSFRSRLGLNRQKLEQEAQMEAEMEL